MHSEPKATMSEQNEATDSNGSPPNSTADSLSQPIDAGAPPRLPFPVVGIGASAGGLEAIGEFFKTLRPDAGMAYVMIQHLPPDRESMMVEILSKKTSMPVSEVQNGIAIQPNHVYVIRPGHTLIIENGRLLLGERLTSPGNNRPIDDFFRSLAAEQRERAIGIILSGMGSNGAAGAGDQGGRRVVHRAGTGVRAVPLNAPASDRRGVCRLHIAPRRYPRCSAGVCRASLFARRTGNRCCEVARARASARP